MDFISKQTNEIWVYITRRTPLYIHTQRTEKKHLSKVKRKENFILSV